MPTAMIGPKFYAFDDNGNPLSGGKVFTYQAGTNKPKATFTGEDGSVQNTNPVILNAAGYAAIHLAGAYKIVLKDANDVVVWTADPVTDAAQRQSDFINEQDACYLGPKKIRINGDLTGFYELGRAVRIATNTGFQYGFVRAATFGAGFTIIDLNGPVSLTPGVISAAGGLVTSALFGGFSAEQVADFGFLRQELKSDAGAGMVGTTGGKSVQKRFDTLAEDYLTHERATEVLQEHNDDANAHPGLTGFLIQLTNKAQAAVDAAVFGENLFNTVQEGITATTPGQFFFVPSSEDTEALILYRNISDQGSGVLRTLNFSAGQATKTLVADAFNAQYTMNFSATVNDVAGGEPGFLEVRLQAKKAGGTFTTIATENYNSFGLGRQNYPGQQLTGSFPNAGKNAVFRIVTDGTGSASATTLTYTEGNPEDAAEPVKTFPTQQAMVNFIAEAEAEADRAKDEADRAEAAANAAEATAQDYEIHADQAKAQIDTEVTGFQNYVIQRQVDVDNTIKDLSIVMYLDDDDLSVTLAVGQNIIVGETSDSVTLALNANPCCL